MSEELRLAIYRVVEEALNTVRKHASATRVGLTLDRPTLDRITVSIQDNGRGFDMSRTELGIGILSMQDSCGVVGGTLEIYTSLGNGATIVGSFPVSEGLASEDLTEEPLAARAS